MAMSLLNKKSGEIYQMEQLIIAEQEKNAGILSEMASLREQLRQANAQPPERHVKDADAILALEREKWEEERAALNASLQRAVELKQSAEKDRDFFLAEHAKASSFVLSVRGENVELEKRVQIAEGQARHGVAMVKTTLAARIDYLQRDAREWRMQAIFMREKIDRTNDDIRRRAAEEPELRARCEDLDEELESLQEQITNMDDEIRGKNEQIMHLEVERENWKQEAAKLSDDLNEANAKLEYLGKKGLSGAEIEANGHEFVYRCEWREDGPCPAVFLKQGVRLISVFSLLAPFADLNRRTSETTCFRRGILILIDIYLFHGFRVGNLTFFITVVCVYINFTFSFLDFLVVLNFASNDG
jgi:predicted  nucleic acid-binding Zn-ribbon protein